MELNLAQTLGGALVEQEHVIFEREVRCYRGIRSRAKEVVFDELANELNIHMHCALKF